MAGTDDYKMHSEELPYKSNVHNLFWPSYRWNVGIFFKNDKHSSTPPCISLFFLPSHAVPFFCRNAVAASPCTFSHLDFSDFPTSCHLKFTSFPKHIFGFHLLLVKEHFLTTILHFFPTTAYSTSVSFIPISPFTFISWC